ncbi:MAG: hypothetical protein HY290_29560 [Planctomycetia bacterium]|nr:hypothetical protein [Planctomycetia bacterium]
MNLKLSEDERKAILDIGSQTPGVMVAAGVVAHLLVKRLIFIGTDGRPELTEQGQKVFEGLARP